MSLTGIELEAIADELSRLETGRIQKISVILPDVAVFDLRTQGANALVQFNLTPSCSRVSVVSARPQAPAQAASLQGLFRSRLNGARLDHIAADDSQRLLRMDFSTPAETLRLFFETHETGAALSLINAEERILGIMRTGPSTRPLRPGTVWQPVIPSSRTTKTNRFSPIPQNPWPLSEAINRHYERVSGEREDEGARRRIQTLLRKRLERTKRTLGKIRADRTRMDEAEKHRLYGDLLKPVLNSIPRGATEASVIEWTTDGPKDVLVPLLAHLSAKANMERHYHQHKRLSRSIALVDERLKEFETTAKELDALLARVADMSASELAVLDEELTSRPTEKHVVGSETRIPYREYMSASGKRIWVGRGARDNDTLTFRHARGNDVWLHARGVPGSHVIVPGCGADAPDQETLLDAATLAAHFSGARGELVVDVASTRRKYLQKPKGSPPGAVRYTQERGISLRLENERLARLLATEANRSR